jgi:uncharacterized protein (TIGR02453 family)
MTAFRGWSDAALDFYRRLEVDNSRPFFAANKAVFETEVRAPFEALSELVADEFGPLKVFRPQRDIRFSKDKTPYKTRCYAVGEGAGGTHYYVEVSADGLSAGAGYWMMANDQLGRYRAAVDDEVTGDELAAAVAEVRGEKLRIEGHALKTAPRGYPRDHPRIELLRHKSLAAFRSWTPGKWLGTKAAGDRVIGAWRASAPLVAWLDAHVGPTTEPPTDRWG